MFITSVAADMNSETVKRTINLIPQFLKIKGMNKVSLSTEYLENLIY